MPLGNEIAPSNPVQGAFLIPLGLPIPARPSSRGNRRSRRYTGIKGLEMPDKPEVCCPHCGAEVLPDDYACPNCLRVIPWKSEKDPVPKSSGLPATH